MLPLKSILVATDFSECSQAAFAYGRALAHHFGAQLYVLNVLEIDGFDTAGSDLAYGEMLEIAERSARQQLEAIVEADDRDSLRAVIAVRAIQRPAEAILGYAAENQVDLIVMGTHGRTGLKHLLMGSVAERVVQLSTCPVLTIHAPQQIPAAAGAVA